jgi:hypothetical protein
MQTFYWNRSKSIDENKKMLSAAQVGDICIGFCVKWVKINPDKNGRTWKEIREYQS